jgi:predicted transcriptional regulator
MFPASAAAAKLGVTQQGVYEYIKRYDLQDVLDQAREHMVTGVYIKLTLQQGLRHW